MSAKIAPLQSSASAEEQEKGKTAGDGVTGAGAGASKPGTKKPAAAKADTKKPRFFDTSRFTNRISGAIADGADYEDPSVMRAKSEKKESVLVMFLVAGVCLALLILGIFMVYIGDEKYIVDLMVVGALCIVMGVTSCLVGMVLVMKPLYRQGKEQELQRKAAAAAAVLTSVIAGADPNELLSGASTELPPWNSSEPEPSTSTASHHQQPQPGSTSSQAPRNSDAAGNRPQPASPDSARRGKLSTPSPPLASPRSSGSTTTTTVDCSGVTDTHGSGVGSDALKRVMDDDIRALL